MRLRVGSRPRLGRGVRIRLGKDEKGRGAAVYSLCSGYDACYITMSMIIFDFSLSRIAGLNTLDPCSFELLGLDRGSCCLLSARGSLQTQARFSVVESRLTFWTTTRTTGSDVHRYAHTCSRQTEREKRKKV
jgi:hypothetical protein